MYLSRVFRCKDGYSGIRCQTNELDDFFTRSDRKILSHSVFSQVARQRNRGLQKLVERGGGSRNFPTDRCKFPTAKLVFKSRPIEDFHLL